MNQALLATISLSVLLAACDALQPDRTTLLGVGAGGQVDRPRCDACHGYAPRTGAHRFHLDTLRQSTTPQQITCASCHSASIATGRVRDSAFRFVDPSDTVRGELMTYHTSAGWPWRPFNAALLVNVMDTTVDDTAMSPLHWEARTDDAEQPQWITRTALGAGLPGHANGSIDVVFGSGLGYDSVEFVDDTTMVSRPYQASYDPVRLSCNAVACHKFAMDESRYLWKEPVEKP